MKRMRKLLRLCLVVVLVFCSLSAGMTVSAANKKSDMKAFASLTIGKDKIPLKKKASKWDQWGIDAKKVKIKVKLKKGWKLKKITYFDDEKGKTYKVKNGGKLKLSYGLDSTLKICARKGDESATLKIRLTRDFIEDD